MSMTERSVEEQLAQSKDETRDAFANRALMYAYIYDELELELGAERATELLKRAIRRRGVEIGQRYRAAVESRDLSEVARLFVEGSPSGGEIFQPSVESIDEDAGTLVLRMDGCALKDAWAEAGYSAEKVDHLCDIAAEVDFGTFEGAGLTLSFAERQASPGCSRCLLDLSLPKAAR